MGSKTLKNSDTVDLREELGQAVSKDGLDFRADDHTVACSIKLMAEDDLLTLDELEISLHMAIHARFFVTLVATINLIPEENRQEILNREYSLEMVDDSFPKTPLMRALIQDCGEITDFLVDSGASKRERGASMEEVQAKPVTLSRNMLILNRIAQVNMAVAVFASKVLLELSEFIDPIFYFVGKSALGIYSHVLSDTNSHAESQELDQLQNNDKADMGSERSNSTSSICSEMGADPCVGSDYESGLDSCSDDSIFTEGTLSDDDCASTRERSDAVVSMDGVNLSQSL